MDRRLESSDMNTSKGVRTATKTRDREMACTEGSGAGEITIEGVVQRTYFVSSHFPGGAGAEEFACQCRRHKRLGFDP